MSQLRLYRAPAARTRAVTVTIDGPAMSEFTIGNCLYRLDSWTQQQWDRLPAEGRPACPWRHGDLIVTVRSR